MKYRWVFLGIGESMTLSCGRRNALRMAKRYGKRLNRKFQVSELDGEIIVFRMPGRHASRKYPWEQMKVGDRFDMDCTVRNARNLASRMGIRLDRHFTIEGEDGEVVCRRFR